MPLASALIPSQLNALVPFAYPWCPQLVLPCIGFSWCCERPFPHRGMDQRIQSHDEMCSRCASLIAPPPTSVTESWILHGVGELAVVQPGSRVSAQGEGGGLWRVQGSGVDGGVRDGNGELEGSPPAAPRRSVCREAEAQPVFAFSSFRFLAGSSLFLCLLAVLPWLAPFRSKGLHPMYSRPT